ncbi:riboflavin biosynthesis protein RibF [candidate division TA06 bacterium]|uniref:Riboflavin biosynthesis protein n=1 Tax=candidate division TA06 bacterium TaxID=2250710 RepID=A0A933MHB7_UNCT6|nr:riboflavin biosynthesis protein RibF [candidate division TA06 bacterium]
MLTITRLNNFGKEHPGAVVALGVFDGLHRGHQALIKKLVARALQSGRQSVALTFEPHPQKVLRRTSQPFILTTGPEKKLLLSRMGVDVMAVIRFSKSMAEMAPEQFVKKILVNKLGAATVICGEDCGFGAGREGDIGLLKALGLKYGFMVEGITACKSRQEKIGSTLIRRQIQKGLFNQAVKLLGHPYLINGLVVKGRGVGRKLGYPTANLKANDKLKLIPGDGVYTARALVGKKTYDGMLYIGGRPTFGGKSTRAIEFSAFENPGNLYGRELTLEVHQFIRPDKKFGSLEHLNKTIAGDQIKIRNYFT